MSDETEDFTLLPIGTRITLDGDRVVVRFPDKNAAIVFHEFIRSFVNGEIRLEAVYEKV